MKKIILFAVCFVGLAGLSYHLGTARGQQAPVRAASGVAHRTALLDMGLVFKQYPKFARLRNDLKAKVEAKEVEAKGMVDRIKEAQALLKSGTLKQGSPEYNEKEKELAHLTADFEAHRKQTQMELAKEEAAVYHTINLEIDDMVQRVARHVHYSLVLRFSRDDLNSKEPQKVMQGLSRQVLFHQEEDDITDLVIHYLKRQDQRTVGAPKKSSIRQTAEEQ